MYAAAGRFCEPQTCGGRGSRDTANKLTFFFCKAGRLLLYGGENMLVSRCRFVVWASCFVGVSMTLRFFGKVACVRFARRICRGAPLRYGVCIFVAKQVKIYLAAFSVFLTPAFQLAFAPRFGQDGFATIEASSRLLIKFSLHSILACFCACGLGRALRFFVKSFLAAVSLF